MSNFNPIYVALLEPSSVVELPSVQVVRNDFTWNILVVKKMKKFPALR